MPLANAAQPQKLPSRSQIWGGLGVLPVEQPQHSRVNEAGVWVISMRPQSQWLKWGCRRPWRTVRMKSPCRQPLGSELKAVGKALSQHLTGRECVACLCPWSSHCLTAPHQAARKLSICSQTPVTAQGSFSAAIHRLQRAHVKYLLFMSTGTDRRGRLVR